MKLPIVAYLCAFMLVGILSYLGWILQKSISYTFSYEAMVEETVCQMVKPEYLIKPCQNN